MTAYCTGTINNYCIQELIILGPLLFNITIGTTQGIKYIQKLRFSKIARNNHDKKYVHFPSKESETTTRDRLLVYIIYLLNKKRWSGSTYCKKYLTMMDPKIG